jgi:hypothetical protein
MSALRATVLLALASLALAACGKSEAPSSGDPAAERAAATKRAEEGPYGAQMKALDKAKNLQSDLNKKVEDNLEKADK